MRRISHSDRVAVLKHLVEGCSLRSTARVTGVSLGAVQRTLRDAGPVAAAAHDMRVRKLAPRRVELDEAWSYVGAKRANAPTAKVAESGDLWLWMALDPDTKLLISWLMGGRNAKMALGLVRDLAERIETYPDISTDGYAAYAEAIYEVFEGNAAHTELVYDQKRVVHGEPDLALAGTSFIERLNLTLRMQNRRYTRKTNAFSKSTERHSASVSLWALAYNFMWRHKSLKTTPAVAAGIERHARQMDWLADMMEATYETPQELAERIGLGDLHRARHAHLQAELDRLAAERDADEGDDFDPLGEDW